MPARTDRFVISFAAEPPQEPLPYGRWGDTLAGHFNAAVGEIDTEGEEIGDISTEISWFPRPELRRADVHPGGGEDGRRL